MMSLATTNYLPAIFVPDDGEKYRLLEHHRRFGICAATRYQIMPAEIRPPHPLPLRNLQVKKAQPSIPRRLTFIRWIMGRLAA